MTRPEDAAAIVSVGSTATGSTGPVVLFDGVCNLCNGAVQFMLDHERAPVLRFAALQSDAARALLATVTAADGEPLDAGAIPQISGGVDGSGDSNEDAGPSTIVLVEDGRAYVRSTAALRIARHLRAPWRWLYVLAIVPRFVRDAVYRWIADRRYRWFGKTETCRVPTPELRARFVDAPPEDAG